MKNEYTKDARQIITGTFLEGVISVKAVADYLKSLDELAKELQTEKERVN